MQIWNYSLSDKKAEIWHFCPWGMRETMTKKLKSDSCKAKCVFADFFLSIDMSGKEERIHGWSQHTFFGWRCVGFAILKMGEKID